MPEPKTKVCLNNVQNKTIPGDNKYVLYAVRNCKYLCILKKALHIVEQRVIVQISVEPFFV